MGAHAHVATLTSMWRPLSSSQYGTSASHGAKPRITSCTCLFLSDSGGSQALQKDFQVKIQTFWTQLQVDSMHVFIMQFFFGSKMINSVIHHSQDRPEKCKMIVFNKGFALFVFCFFFVLTTLNIQCGFFQSISGLIQRLGHPWMKKHTPEIPQEDYWSWQTSSQKTVCPETHDITSVSASNKDFLVAHAGVFHYCSIFELVIIVFFQVKT